MLGGWEPTERHDHYDANDNLTGYTIVTRESEWDEMQAALMYGLAGSKDLLCPECGNLREVCADPDADWYPQRHICNASAVLERSNRMYREKHKDAKPDENGYKPDDGTRVWVSRYDLTPDDDFI